MTTPATTSPVPTAPNSEVTLAKTGSAAPVRETAVRTPDVRSAVAGGTAGVGNTTSAAVESGSPKDSYSDEPPAKLSKVQSALGVVAGIVIVALVAAIVVLLIDRKNASDLAAERATYVDVARATAINISTLRSDSAKEDLDKLFEGTTGPLRADLDARLDDFAGVVAQLNVSTTGEVVEAGLESEDGNCKTSLVAVKANQKNADEAPVDKSFRLRVVICDEGGKLLASNVEFVP
ncbi:mammalian cell entry protein [Prescottella defluvii]|uniref:mammalian cell entry protein n=1 Tax=Prescottella defluvii TaxID=1323361 RepID=UPI001E507BB8|nr:mammalian cell entry protein [Prescottella defluvii]